uniref:DUF4843 domain-containing protein n=1 Tax=Pedobacter schmidteae TaxID=2201271 RepID=UPI000EAC28BF|nr:DUF4843 domain-containing protein [Pedobacter schmidteae]
MMNNNRYIAMFLLLCTALVACKKELKTYDGLTGIYFAPAVDTRNYVGVDSTAISFAFAKASLMDSVMKLVVRVSGEPVNRERGFKLSIDPTSTAIVGQHYEILNSGFVIPANKVADTLKIKMKRTTDMLSQTFTIRLKLEANENFDTPMQDRVINTVTGKKLSFITHTIWVNDIVKKPKAWLDDYLGPFSRKKLFLLAEVAEIKNIGDLDDYVITSISKLNYYGAFMQRYLNEMKANNKTIYEADEKTEMIMGPRVQ